MKNLKQINKIIQDHEKRISALESKSVGFKSSKITKGKKSLLDYIIALRDKGFFSEAKTAGETQKKLQGVYTCEIDRVAMALLRLANKKQLRKAIRVIDEKKYRAYVW